MSKVINILAAGDYETSDRIRRFIDKMYETYQEAEKKGLFQIGEWRVVGTKKEVEDTLSTEQFDIIICFSPLDNAKIGSGSMRNWIEIQKHLRILLFMDLIVRDGDPEQNIGPSKKPGLLYENGFFDCFFTGTFLSADLIRVTLNGRTKEEAYHYYGLDRTEEENEIKEIEELKEEELKEEELKEEENTTLPDTNEQTEPERLNIDSDVIPNDKNEHQNEIKKQQEIASVEHEESEDEDFIEADIVYVCDDDTAVIKLKSSDIHLSNVQYQNTTIKILLSHNSDI